MRRLLIPLLALLTPLLAGCAGVFFYPQRELTLTPQAVDLVYEDVSLRAADGVALHAWYLPAQGETKGTLLFLHGNGGNVATQLPSVFWLPAEGYGVLLLDYRGYGESAGKASIPGALRDVEAALAWLDARPEVGERGMGVLGQSLGGAFAAHAVAHTAHRERIRAVVIDSAFSDYRRIVREKLGAFWLTWPLQWPLSLTIPSTYDPVDSIGDIAPIPLLILHSEHDTIVPPAHAEALYEAAREPKTYWRIREGGHISALAYAEARRLLVEWLDLLFAHPRDGAEEHVPE
jgi:fermentation-respiration switch protein FrsA (DUF1100 family)